MVYKSKVRRFLTTLIFLMVVATLIALIYFQSTRYPALDDAASCYVNNPAAQVTADRISFQPQESKASVGLIIYPGGNVDFHAYAPLAGRISAGGFPVFVQKMPLDLAVFGINRGNRIISDHPQIDTWVIAGHSLGGAMGARFAVNHPDQIRGVIFLAAYPDVDLSQSALRVLSIYGDRDGVLNEERFNDSLALLPEDAVILEIPGANHAGFAHYGPQMNDLTGSMIREEQQRITAETILSFLDTLVETD